MSRFNKKAIFLSTIFVTAVLTVGLYLLINLNSSAVAFEYFPLNKPQEIKFPSDINSFHNYTERQKKNQFLDWLLLTIESDPSFSIEEIVEISYDTFPVRYDYLKPVSNFEYSNIRSFYTGKNTIIALLPKNSSPAEKIDYLAEIADEHRQNLGKIPQNLVLFEYEFDSDLQTAQVNYVKQIKTKILFQLDKYGYLETHLKSFEDLSKFMAEIDDITFAKVQGANLVVGGRKITSHDYGKISSEDIAALWQSEHKIIKQPYVFKVNGSGFSLDPAFDYQGLKESLSKIQPRLKDLNSDNQSFISDAEIEAVQQGLSEKDIVPYLKLVEKLQANFNSKESSVLKAFKTQVNLQVEQKIAVAKQEFEQQITQYKNQLQQELDSIAQEIKQSNSPVTAKKQLYDQKVQEQSEKFQNYQQDLQSQIDENIQQYISQEESALTEINQFLKTPLTQGFQNARYDGDLQGTEVGMVLYYTDLVAKLWALNYLETTPEKYISDFEPLTKRAAKISSIYKPELEQLPSTRLWFGHRDTGFQMANNGNSILMARNSTRIYAASSNPLEPGIESTAAANSEAFLGWWNKHYAEVARYENQYERLNEIMKWSFVISWLNHSSQNNFLGFLQDVPVNHDYWFPDWVKANQEQLKFKEWTTETCSENSDFDADQAPVCFYPRGYQGLKTEAMPLLRSKAFTQFAENKFISGGVSLASRQLIDQQTPLPRFSKISDRSLRGNIDYKSTRLQDKLLSFDTFDGVTYGMKIGQPLAIVTAMAQDGTKLRNLDSELDNVEVTKQVSRVNQGIKMNVKAGDIDLGSFSTSKKGDTFLVNWQSLDIDVGQSVALELSSAKSEPTSFLNSHPQVNSLAIQQDGSTYYVKLDNSKQWLKLASGGSDSVKIPVSWTSRIASTEDSGSFSYLLAWMKDADVKKQLSKGNIKEVALSY